MIEGTAAAMVQRQECRHGGRGQWDREQHEARTSPCKADSWWEVYVQHKELTLVLCDSLGGGTGGRLRQRGRNTLAAASYCCTTETNTAL